MSINQLSNIKKSLFCLLIMLPVDFSFACPGCAGSMENPKDMTYVWVIGIFVLLIYIPFYLIYKMIYKHRNANSLDDESDTISAEEGH